MVIVGHICRETGKVCECATVNGYCQMTACINPPVTVTTWAWQKPKEGDSMIKVFTMNKNGKIELTKDELKKLLDEAYWEGYRANNAWTYQTPNWSPYVFTANGTGAPIDANIIKSGTIDGYAVNLKSDNTEHKR